jgi:hypothetical protein
MRSFFKFLCFSSFTLIALPAFSCTLLEMRTNLERTPDVVASKENGGIVQSSDPNMFTSFEKRVTCTDSDLLKLGFQFKSMQRYAPGASTNGAYETVSSYQLNDFLIHCYTEFALDKPGLEAKVLWVRNVCQQITPAKLIKK